MSKLKVIRATRGSNFPSEKWNKKFGVKKKRDERGYLEGKDSPK